MFRILRRYYRSGYSGPVQRMALRAAVALSEWASIDANPLLRRDLRGTQRRDDLRRPWWALAMAVAALCLLYHYARAWCDQVQLRGDISELSSDLHDIEPDVRAALQALGSHPLAVVATLTCGVSAAVTWWVCQQRASGLLRREQLQGTLEQLQLLPIAEERWLWMMTAQPALAGLLVALPGLPLYLMAAATGAWSWSDVVGLVLAFGTLINVLPWLVVPRPAAGTQTRKAGTASQSTAATVEGRSPVELPPYGSLFSRWSMVDPAWWIVALLLKQGVEETLRWVQDAPSASASSVDQFAWLSRLVLSLPPRISGLLPGWPLTWPLMLARLLFTPFPFFAWTLTPVVLLVPLWLGFRINRFSTLAGRVSCVNNFWRRRRARRRRAMGRLLTWCWGLLLVGYGWRPLMLDGRLAALLDAPHTVAWAIATAWTIALILGTVVAGRGIMLALAADNYSALTKPIWRSVGTVLMSGVGGAVALYWIACWLGGCAGISEPWRERLIPTLATAAAFLMALLGSVLVEAGVPAGWRRYWRWVCSFWFLGLPVEAAGRALFELVRRAPEGIIGSFHFEQAPHLLLSPTVSLAALCRSHLSSPGLSWWEGPLFQIVVGAGCLAVYIVAGLRRHHVVAEISGVAGMMWLQRMARVLNALWRWLACLAPCWQPLIRLINALSEGHKALINFIVVHAARLDNPLVTASCRKQARLWSGLWLTAVCLPALLILLVGRPWELFQFTWPLGGGWAAPVRMSTSSSWQSWGSNVTALCLVATQALVIIAVLGLGQAFDADRTSGALVFLFLTPMRDHEILLGKLLPPVLFAASLLVALLPFVTLGGLVAGWGGDWTALVVAGPALLAITAALVSVATWQVLCATRATSPAAGILKALAGTIAIEICTMFLVGGSVMTDSIPCVIGTLMAVTCAHCALAVACWRSSSAALRVQRYGDVMLIQASGLPNLRAGSPRSIESYPL